MHLDGPLNSKPDGTTLQNRNTVIRERPGAWTSEPGTLLLGELKKSVMGEIQLPDNSKLLFLNSDELVIVKGNGFYSLKTSSVFNFTKPIHGKAAYNNRNEIVVTWTDGTTPRYLNLSKIPDSITEDNISLNIYREDPVVFIESIANAGGLLSGVYYPMIQGITDEGSYGSWLIQRPIKIFTNGLTGIDQTEGQKSGVVTNQAIRLTITSGEYTSYNYGYIYKQNGELFAYNVGKSGNTFTYTGSEVRTTVTLDEALLERAYFKNVGLIETLGNVLYMANLEYYDEKDIQVDVNNIKVRWVSELISVDSLKLNTQTAGFMPGEVYALYFRYIYKWGRGSWFTIPGREKLPIIDTNFLTQDTADLTGRTNYWENTDELYPNEPRFGALRNTKVRHHGLPSLNWLRTNVHKGPEVGINYLPRLTFELQNVPVNADAIGWELGYAERTPSNSLVLGMSPVLNTVYDSNDDSQPNKFFSLGANMTTPFGDPNGFTATAVEGHLFRVYPIELLLGASAQIQSFRKEYKLKSAPFTPVFKGRREPSAPTQEEIDKPYFRVNGWINYRAGTVTPVADQRLIVTSDFLPQNAFLKRIDNFSLEKTYILDTNNAANPFPVVSFVLTTTQSYQEETYLLSLLTNTKNCYKQFDKQEIVIAGSNSQAFIGDCYVTEYTYHTYGKKRVNEEKYGLFDAGMIFARTIALYSVHPIALRYTNPGANEYTEYAPKQIVDKYTDAWTVDREPNGFIEGFNRDYSAIFNVVPSTFFDAKKQYKFTNWITRSQIYQSTDNWFGWRDFRPNDILIMTANNGPITNMVGTGDLMYIHFEGNLFITRGGEELQIVGRKAVYVGTGDVFAAQPEEIIHDKYGALGLQHRICSVLTSYGYCFIDTLTGIGAVYLVNGKDVKVLSDEGMIEFFRNNLLLFNDSVRGKNIQLGYDPQYKRLLVMHKGQLPKDINNYRGEYSPNMILQGGDIVYKDEKFVKVIITNTDF